MCSPQSMRMMTLSRLGYGVEACSRRIPGVGINERDDVGPMEEEEGEQEGRGGGDAGSEGGAGAGG